MPDGIELAFIALHGTLAKTARCRESWKNAAIAYTGEGVAESELAFDKIRSKEAFRQHGVTTPYWQIITRRPAARRFPFRSSSKRRGRARRSACISSGMSAKSMRRLRTPRKYDREFLVEKFVPGRELTIGILGEQALPIMEIIPKGGFYDFTNKYPFLNPSAGGGAEHVCPAQIPEEQTRAIQDLALAGASLARAAGLFAGGHHVARRRRADVSWK